MISTTFELNLEFSKITESLRAKDIDLSQALDNLTILANEAASCGLPFDVHEAELGLRIDLGLPVRENDV